MRAIKYIVSSILILIFSNSFSQSTILTNKKRREFNENFIKLDSNYSGNNYWEEYEKIVSKYTKFDVTHEDVFNINMGDILILENEINVIQSVKGDDVYYREISSNTEHKISLNYLASNIREIKKSKRRVKYSKYSDMYDYISITSHIIKK